jgi:hypothetical protein
MSNLLEWLRAQLDEDERIALSLDDYDEYGTDLTVGTCMGYPCERYLAIGRNRALADVMAKRRLISQILRYEAKIDGEWGCCHSPRDIGAGKCKDAPVNEINALRILAQSYVGRPGYDEAWRPGDVVADDLDDD